MRRVQRNQTRGRGTSTRRNLLKPSPCVQQWLFVLVLLPTGGLPTQSLTGDDRTELFRVTRGGQEMQHHTNIYRVRALADAHPLVHSVCEHKVTKALDDSQFNGDGRVTKCHQSPWDLKLTVGGEEMIVGVSGNGVVVALLSLLVVVAVC